MKKLILIGLLAVASASVASADYKYGQCQAIAKSTGKQCKIGVSNPGDKFCHLHK